MTLPSNSPSLSRSSCCRCRPFSRKRQLFFFYEIGEFALEATLIGPLDVIIGLLCISQHPGNNHK